VSRLGFFVKERARLARELLFLVLALGAVWPIWVVEFPPIQDLPQHLAAIRVLHDYTDPSFGFAQFFVTALSKTQYLAYYFAAHLLSYVLGIELANRVFITVAIAALPYALRAALRAFERDQLLALFAFPLLWNAHLLLGFVNFIAALALLFWGIALSVWERRAPSLRGKFLLLSVVLVTFYMHVVPFAFLALAVVVLGVGDGVVQTLRRWAVLAPTLAAALLWMLTSPAGAAVRSASGLTKSEPGLRPVFMRWSDALREAPNWLTDILPGELDEQLLIAWGALVLGCIGAGVVGRSSAPSSRDERCEAGRALAARWLVRLAPFAPLALLAYFVAPASYSWIWPINARFPLLALLFLILVLPEPRGFLRVGLALALGVVSLVSSLEVTKAFRDFQKYEVAEFDDALAVIPKGQKVVGLIWDRGSRYVKFSPFLHAAAWYQAKKGGAVMFTFADFPQSPFRFRESNRPPRVEPRWEWLPERVDVVNDLTFYDYVLTRGGPGAVASHPEIFDAIFNGPHWSVWHRRRAQ
jgi:hypothetical protein